MFLHIFINRFKCIIRDKQTIVWTIIFPLILATLFRMAIPDEDFSISFETINVAVVDTEEYSQNINFKNAITSATDSTTDKKLFNVSVVSQADADKMLINNDIAGYIIVKDDIKLVVKNSEFTQMILKEFINNYIQVSAQYEKIYLNNPQAFYELLSKEVVNVDYISEASANASKTNNSLNYYYALIGMTCLFGALLGLGEIINIEPNQSDKGARVSVSPISKLKLFAYSIFTITVIQILIIFLLLFYLLFVLQIDFSNQLGYVALTGVLGSFIGVSFGAMIGAVIRGKESVKIAIIIAVSNILSFLAGLMYSNMKYIVETHIPILNRINPASLISDSFYSLYYYDTYTKYFQNILILTIMSVAFYGIVFLAMRRKKYASI